MGWDGIHCGDQSVISRSREFCSFLDGTGTGTGKKWSRKKVLVPVPEKILGTVTLW